MAIEDKSKRGPSAEWLERAGDAEEAAGGCISVGGMAADFGMLGDPNRTQALSDDWADEGGIRLRVEPDGRQGLRFLVVDVTDGWPGKIVAGATMASWRAKRIIDAASKYLTDSEPAKD